MVDDAPDERERVYQRIAPIILGFHATNSDRDFHIEELRRFVRDQVPEIAPDSPGRILRELRLQGRLDYTVVNRRQSLYRFVSNFDTEDVSMVHAAREHAKFSFSAAHRWMHCYGQPNLLQTMPDIRRRSTAAAEEGTLAHEAAETLLRSGSRNYAVLPDEIRTSVAMYVDEIDAIRAAAPDIQFDFEKACAFPQDVVPARDCVGILDAVGYSRSLRAGWIVDFKHGVVPVDAGENAQLLTGATAAFWDVPIDVITMTIVQPNGYVGKPVKSSEVRASDLPDFVDEVEQALRIASQPDAPLVAGDHCHFCPAEPVCLVREELALREIIDAPEARSLPIDAEAYTKAIDLAPDRITAILNATAGLKAWLNSVSNYALEQALAGTKFPGWKVVEARAQRRWEGDPAKIADELIVMSNYELGLDDVMPRSLVNITDIEAKLKQITSDQAPAGKKRKAVEDLGRDFAFLTTKTSSGNHSLAPESDKREAAKPVAAGFAHVQIEAPNAIPTGET